MKPGYKFLRNILFGLLVTGTVVFISLFAAGYVKLSAQNTEACFACHEDPDLTADRNGKKVSMYVNPAAYKKSVHSMAECVDCHTGYNPDELPHSKTPVKVDCKSCHQESLKGIEAGVHKQVNCYDCHTKHDVAPGKEIRVNQTQNCQKCHNTKGIQQYKTSIHAKKNVGCEGCHLGGHSSKKISKNEVAATCGKCHGSHEKNFNNSVHQTVLQSGNQNAPTCTDCHGSHQILTSKMTIESQSCLKCHLDEKLFPGEGRGSAKFVADYKTSVHASIEKGGKEAAGCSDCHGDHMIQDPNNPQASTIRAKMLETCGKCHQQEVEHFKKSQHGTELMKGNFKAPTCASCHGEHNIKSVVSSKEFTKLNQVELCLSCHVDQKLPHKNYKGEEVLISNYKDSYHYRALQEGKLNAATCSDCHGAHEMKKFDDPEAQIYKKNIAKTCGQSDCHTKQLGDYNGSIHEQSLLDKNNPDAPTCNTCHGNHQILKKDESESRIASSKGLVQLCSDCHNSVEMTEKYDLPTGRTESYLESFHGLAVRGGSKVAANCESCHGNHNIRPSTDSLSTISKKNLPETCGKCHPGAVTAFFNTPIHIVKPEEENPWMYWVTNFYIFMIIAVIGGMVLHNVVDFSKKFKKKK
ncbi:MAG: hypothetical protein EHM58_05385 [Ignavibacteriae bacterium]|nr:MAG: hypothetical protein EHM58_05385 [Ignavibacteriota bacterium]